MISQDLIDAACDAEEVFTLDELEQYAMNTNEQPKAAPVEQWFVSGDDDQWQNAGGPYASKEEAIAAGPQDFTWDDFPDDETQVIFYVGRQVSHVPVVDATAVIETLMTEAYDECGEVAEDWLSDISEEAAEDLQDALQAVFEVWMEKHGYEPNNFWLVEDITPHVWHRDLAE